MAFNGGVHGGAPCTKREKIEKNRHFWPILKKIVKLLCNQHHQPWHHQTWCTYTMGITVTDSERKTEILLLSLSQNLVKKLF